MIWYLQTNILNNMIKVIKHKKASQSQLNQDQNNRKRVTIYMTSILGRSIKQN